MGIIGIYPPAMTTAPVITIPITAIIITSITMGIVTLMQKTPIPEKLCLIKQ
jgi:hypothetical protein